MRIIEYTHSLEFYCKAYIISKKDIIEVEAEK
jgi:hypothetical protein